jgi:hypothetical protein
LFPYPKDDNYGVDELTSTIDCHAIVKSRAARQRFFDEVGRRVLLDLTAGLDAWIEGARPVLLFDGLDPRGATRPCGEPREAKIFGSDDDVAALFQRNNKLIGEGDLKLAWVEERVRQLAEEGTLPMELHLTVTIDTDSIAIELLEQARRNCGPPPAHAVKGALCMRERAVKRDYDDEDASASFFVVDYANLLEILMAKMYGVSTSRLDLLPDAQTQRAATALMCCGWALAGCDFVSVGGLKASMIMETLPSMLQASPTLVAGFARVWSGDREAVKLVTPALRRLVRLCAENYAEQPRARKATVAKLKEVDESVLLRGAWTGAYWSMNEIAGDLADFGFTASSSVDAKVLEPTQLAKASVLKAKPPPVLCSADVGAKMVRSKYFGGDGDSSSRSPAEAICELGWPGAR